MKTFDEIANNIDNIAYYANNIDRLTKEQFNEDCNKYEAVTDMTNRLDLLGAIGGAVSKILLLCEQMKSNLQHAQEVKLPYKQEELL